MDDARIAKIDESLARQLGRSIEKNAKLTAALRLTLEELTSCANQLESLGFNSSDGGSVRHAQNMARDVLNGH